MLLIWRSTSASRLSTLSLTSRWIRARSSSTARIMAELADPTRGSTVTSTRMISRAWMPGVRRPSSASIGAMPAHRRALGQTSAEHPALGREPQQHLANGLEMDWAALALLGPRVDVAQPALEWIL